LYDYFSTQSTKHINLFAPILARVSNFGHGRHWALPFATIHEKPFPLLNFCRSLNHPSVGPTAERTVPHEMKAAT